MWFLHDTLVACLISLGWCLMFALPLRYMPACMLITAIAFGGKALLVHYAWHTAVATFVGTACASFAGVYFAQKYRITPKALIVPSVICLMPGIAAYQAMVGAVQIGYFGFHLEGFERMMASFFEAIFVMSALVLGLSLPGLLFYRQRPIV